MASRLAAPLLCLLLWTSDPLPVDRDFAPQRLVLTYRLELCRTQGSLDLALRVIRLLEGPVTPSRTEEARLPIPKPDAVPEDPPEYSEEAWR